MLRFTFMAQCHVQNELVVVEEEKNVALKIEEKLKKEEKKLCGFVEAETRKKCFWCGEEWNYC
jgi:hypothetical protein